MDPNAISELRSVRARGANVGDIRDFGGTKWRWDGVQWTQERDPNSPEELIKSISREIADVQQKYIDRGAEFDAKNPFMFDEVQAKASAEQRYNPYYNAELNDYVKGINVQRESTQGEMDLLRNLNRVQMGTDKRALDEAIRSSEEGYAGAGLFFSGKQERGTGLTKIAGQEQAQTRDMTYNERMAGFGRNLETLSNQEATGRRQIGAERTTNIESEIAKQKAEEEARHATERAQYVGYPGVNMSSGFNQILQSAFQY